MNLIHIDQNWIAANYSEGALFFEEPDTEYCFQTDFEADGTAVFTRNSNIVVNLNGHKISFGLDPGRDGAVGIYPFSARNDKGVGSDSVNYSKTETESWNKKNVMIKNGSIVWGSGAGPGTWATAIGGRNTANNITIDNCYLETGGQDGMCVNLGGDMTLTNTHAVCRSRSTVDRHQTPANIKVGGKLTARHNILEGGLSAFAVGSESEIVQNVMRQLGFATNGYGVMLYRVGNVIVRENLILPTNGRGVMHNAGTGHLVEDNLIVVHEQPNAEFGNNLSPPCFRSRYELSGNVFRRNRCLAIGGGENANAKGAYLTEYPDAEIPNQIIENEFRAVLTSAADSKAVMAMSLEGQGKAESFTKTIIERNRLVSNNILLALSRSDGGCYQETIKNNSMEWAIGRASYLWFLSAVSENRYMFEYSEANSFVNPDLLVLIKGDVADEVEALIAEVPDSVGNRSTFYAGWWTLDSKITLMDTQLGDGVTMGVLDIAGANKGAIDIKVGTNDVVDYSLIKAAGAGEPITRVEGNGTIPPEPEPEPVPPSAPY
jgi:hypothetical protein